MDLNMTKVRRTLLYIPYSLTAEVVIQPLQNYNYIHMYHTTCNMNNEHDL